MYFWGVVQSYRVATDAELGTTWVLMTFRYDYLVYKQVTGPHTT